LSRQDVGLILLVFKEMMIVYEGYWNIISQPFKNFILEKCYKGMDLCEYHDKIASTLENSENSVRKLEEEIFHLYHGKQYFRLKQKISDIDTFLL
jgi:hypothetical protein